MLLCHNVWHPVLTADIAHSKKISHDQDIMDVTNIICSNWITHQNELTEVMLQKMQMLQSLATLFQDVNRGEALLSKSYIHNFFSFTTSLSNIVCQK